MGRTTKIDWCDSTWNPVTGCLHGCNYCYARRIAHRFGGYIEGNRAKAERWVLRDTSQPPVAEFDVPQIRLDKCGRKVSAPYPLYFMPTFHRYKLDEPVSWIKPRSIFVCSMSDLFGEWVPDTWIRTVFESCREAPQHRYLMLTKNARRYHDVYLDMPIDDIDVWLGTTYTGDGHYTQHDLPPRVNRFVSIEPLLDMPDPHDMSAILGENDWVIIGAETGHRSDTVIPSRSWIDAITRACDVAGVPVFMKESLRRIMGPDFRQEFPWEVDDE